MGFDTGLVSLWRDPHAGAKGDGGTLVEGHGKGLAGVYVTEPVLEPRP